MPKLELFPRAECTAWSTSVDGLAAELGRPQTTDCPAETAAVLTDNQLTACYSKPL